MSSRGRWSQEQEEIIKQLREADAERSWKEIAKRLNEQLPGSKATGKQCRERYINYLRFDQQNCKALEWTKEDDKKFTNLFLEYGAKWALICTMMPQRSENCLKNRYYGGLRRVIRKINKVERKNKTRKSKPIRYQTLIRILNWENSFPETAASIPEPSNNISNFLRQLKKSLLQNTWNYLNAQDSEQEMLSLIDQIHEFNSRIRTLVSKNGKTQKSRDSQNIIKAESKKYVEEEFQKCQEHEKGVTPESIPAYSNKFWVLQLEGPISNTPENQISLSNYEISWPENKSKTISQTDNLELVVSQILQEEYVPSDFTFIS